nr:hypothetical protein Iba_chr09fCG1420 [Ipomoea batatas]
MTLQGAMLLNMGMPMVTADLGGLILDIVAAEVVYLVRIHVGCIIVAMVWAMVEAPIVVMTLVGCTHHQGMVVITCLVVVMSVVVPIRHFILVVAWAVVVIWGAVGLDLIIEVSY